MEQLIQMLFGAIAVVGGLVAVTLAAVVGALVWCVRRAAYAIQGKEYKPLFGDKTQHEYEHQDVDEGATAESVERVLKRYQRSTVVGKRAQAAMTALDDVERKCSAFRAVLGKKFQPGSMSWDKFSIAADITYDAVLRNCASIANRIQVFDRSGYQKKELGHRSSTWRERDAEDSQSAEKQRVLQEGLDQMDELLASNDQLLTELDKLTIELGKLTDADSNADGERIVEEIRTLIDETKYYSQQGC